MLETLKAAAAWLSANIDPTVPRALFVVGVLVAVLLIRKAFPRAWEAFARVVRVPVIDPAPLLLLASKAWQALPGTVIGAATAAIGTGGDVRAAIKGAIFGALAALAHEVLKAVPWIPYTGAVGKKGLPPGAALGAIYLLSIIGCASLGQAMKAAPCDDDKLKAIDRDYVAVLLATCLAKYDRKEACPEYPALEADHRKRLREECHQ